MKTERLKEDADASKGFVISFDDDDKPKKPKPELKNRRLSSGTAPATPGGGPAKKHSGVLGSGNPMGETLSSDGSNSSRKENMDPTAKGMGGGGAPRGVMICIDMNNTGNDSSEAETAAMVAHSAGGKDRRMSSTSPQRKYSPGQWRRCCC